MDFMKNTLSQVNVEEETLYDFIYDLVFFMALNESEDDIKNGRLYTLEEFDAEKYERSMREEGREEGKEEGDAIRLVSSVDAAMRNFHIDLETACRGLDTTTDEYYRAKGQSIPY